MSIPVKVPALPRGVTTAKIGHWYKSVGEVIARNECLVEVLTIYGDLIPIVVNQAGVVEEILSTTGDVVEVNAIIAYIKVGLPNLVWDPEQKTLLLETYQTHDKGMTPETDLYVRELLRKEEGKIGHGFGSPLAIQPHNRREAGHGMDFGESQANRCKPHPLLAKSSQFSGVDKNPDATRVPANDAAQNSPQIKPNLAPQPQPSMSPTPTPKPSPR